MQRANMSVAIVCMVDNQNCSSPSLNVLTNVTQNESEIIKNTDLNSNLTQAVKKCQVSYYDTLLVPYTQRLIQNVDCLE